MQAIRQHLQPVQRLYNRWLNGGYIFDILQYKGGQTVGTDYISRVFQSRTHEIQQKYSTALQSTRNPNLLNMITDNWHRFLLFNAFDRLITAYQAYPSLKQRFQFPGTYSHTFTQIMNEGVFRGALKGVTMSLLQFSTVMFPAVYLTSKSKSQNKLSRFLFNYTIFDTLMYPLDSVKNILYADTLGTMRLKALFERVALTDLYGGYSAKMIFNIPWLSGLYFTTQVGREKQALMSWLATLLFYPLNTIKVCHQLAGSQLSSMYGEQRNNFTIRQGFRGAIPFIALNSLIGWQLRPLFSQQKLQQIKKEVSQQQKQYLGLS